MNTSIQTLSFQNFPVSFRADGYLNATEIAQSFGKRVRDYLVNERTQEYITALAEAVKTASGNPETVKTASAENQLVIVKKGGNDKSAQGTWLHPKLAIDFARWLNPKFAVWCDIQIEKILHQNSGSLKQIPNKTTSLDREPLRNAVNMLVSKKGLNYSEAYKLVHQRFNVAHLDELDREQIPQAVEYVHRVLCGEVLDKLDAPPQVQQAQIPETALRHIAGIVRLTPLLMRYCKKHNDGLEHFTGRRDLEMYTSFLDCHSHAMKLADMFHINRELWRYPAANW